VTYFRFLFMKLIYVIVFVLTAGLSPAVYGAPVELSDSLLDHVTAGSAEVASHNGGLIVGNTSTALVRNFDEVQLAGEAQKNAKSLNLVNSSEASVANGVNLWIGNPAAEPEESPVTVSQVNFFDQDRRISTKAGEWIYEGENVTETSIESSTASFHGGIIPETLTFNGTSTKTEGGETTQFSDPPAEEIRVSVGVTWAGEVSGEIGDSTITLFSSDTVTTEVTASITVFGIKIDLGGTKTTFEKKIEEEEVVKGMTIPKTKGVGCIVSRGDCFGDGMFAVASENTRKVFTPALPSPDSSAELIVMGEGRLDLQDNFKVNLSQQSQQSTRAFNLVNSGGGILANGANLSRPTGFGSGAFRQNNSIFQKR
jgi:hypothetical protein